MTRDDLNSIIRLAGIKRNISEVEGISPPPNDNPGVLRSSDGKPVGSSDPDINWSAGSASSTTATPPNNFATTRPTIGRPFGSNDESIVRDPGVDPKIPFSKMLPILRDVTRLTTYKGQVVAVTKTGEIRGLWDDGSWKAGGGMPAEFRDQNVNVSTQSINPPRIDIQPINPAGQQSGAAPEAGPSGVDPAVQAQVDRLRSEYNNSSVTAAPGQQVNSSPGNNVDVFAPLTEPPPEGSSALDPARNPDSNTNIGGGPQGPAGRVPPKKLLPVDPDLKKIQSVLASSEEYKKLLGSYGADGRIGKFTRNALATYIKDHPDEDDPVFLKILKKYNIPASSTPVSGPQGPSGTPPTPAGVSGPSGAPTPPNPNQRPTMPNDPRRTDASAATGPSGAPAGVSGPSGAPAGVSGPSGTPPKRSLDAIGSSTDKAAAALTPSKNESVETPVGQIQKFRQLVDEAEWSDEFKQSIQHANAEAEKARANTPRSTSQWGTPIDPIDSSTNLGRKEPALGNPEPVAGKPEPKMPPTSTPKAGTPVPGNPSFEYTGKVGSNGKPEVKKIVQAAADATSTAGKATTTAAQPATTTSFKQGDYSVKTNAPTGITPPNKLNTVAQATADATSTAGKTSTMAGKAAKAWELIKNIPGVKQVATQAGRILPGAGIAFGLQDIKTRTDAGDDTGAAIAGLTTAASALPLPVVSEFAAALGISVQMARDKIRTGSIMPSDAEILAGVSQDAYEKEHKEQLKKDLQDIQSYLTDKTLSPEDQIKARAIADKIKRALNLTSDVGSAWGSIGMPGRARRQ
jgi:hypothetical protein